MTKMKFKKKEHLPRSEAAARLAEIAKALRNSAKFEVEHRGEQLEMELDVPEDVTLEFEIEMKDSETELEFEIKWASVTSPVPASAASTEPESSS